jgi:hypothetical protein
MFQSSSTVCVRCHYTLYTVMRKPPLRPLNNAIVWVPPCGWGASPPIRKYIRTTHCTYRHHIFGITQKDVIYCNRFVPCRYIAQYANSREPRELVIIVKVLLTLENNRYNRIGMVQCRLELTYRRRRLDFLRLVLDFPFCDFLLCMLRRDLRLPPITLSSVLQISPKHSTIIFEPSQCV